MEKRTTVYIIMILLSFIGILALNNCKVSGLPGPRIYIDPTPIYFDAANGTVGTRFNVTIWIENVTEPGLDGWQVELHYDDSIINVTQDENGIRAWPSMYRGANKFNTSYVFYTATAVVSSIIEPMYAHIDPHNGSVLIADATIGTEDKFIGDKGLMGIIEFQLTATPKNSILDITNSYSWIKPNEINIIATFQDGEIIPELSLATLLVFFLCSAIVTLLFRKKITYA